jgi:hypothetical protein
MGSDVSSANPYWFGYYETGLRAYLFDGSGDTIVTDPDDYSSHVGSWHHLTATYNGSAGTLSIFVDGSLTVATAMAPAALSYPGGVLRVGVDTNSGNVGVPFTGDIDEVKLFGCELTESQVSRDLATNWPFP